MYRRPEIRGGKLTFGGLRGQHSKPAVGAAIDPDVERLAIIAEPPAEPVHDSLNPLRRNPPVLGDMCDGDFGTVAVSRDAGSVPIAVSGRMTVSDDAVSVSVATVHLLIVPVGRHRTREFDPADAAHFIGKDTSEKYEVSRIFEIRQGRKHPQVGDLGR
jgi:hypothetical protein